MPKSHTVQSVPRSSLRDFGEARAAVQRQAEGRGQAVGFGRFGGSGMGAAWLPGGGRLAEQRVGQGAGRRAVGELSSGEPCAAPGGGGWGPVCHRAHGRWASRAGWAAGPAAVDQTAGSAGARWAPDSQRSVQLGSHIGSAARVADSALGRATRPGGAWPRRAPPRRCPQMGRSQSAWGDKGASDEWGVPSSSRCFLVEDPQTLRDDVVGAPRRSAS